MGIIAGDGAGKFNPGGPLTAEQTAKMFLTAMGYNAEVFGLVGANWAMNVGRYANEAGLYDELGDITPSQPISRDDAAQMAYNAIQSPMMVRSWTQDQTTGVVTEAYQLADGKGNIGFVSLLLDKFDANIYEGVLGATGEYATTIAHTDPDGFSVSVEKINGSNVVNSSGVVTIVDTYFEYEDQDLSDLMGQYVKVIYADDNDTCYGVYAVAEKNTVVETAVSLTDYTGLANRVRIDGVVYNLETDIVTYDGEGCVGNTVAACKTATSDVHSADPVKFIDNDGNGKFDLALITPMNVAEITFVNDTRLTMNMMSNRVAVINGASQEVADLVIDGDLAKGDFAVVTPGYYLDADTVVETTVTSGTVTGVRTSGGSITDWQIDGVWYKRANGYTVSTAIKSGSVVDYVGIDGVLYYAKLTSGATLSDVAVIYDLGVESDATFGGSTLKGKIILSDGTTKDVTVAALYDAYDDTINKVVLSGGIATEETYIGVPMSYKVNNDGEYEFYKLSDTPNDRAGMDLFDDGLTVTVGGNGDLQIGSYLVADEAVVVVLNDQPGTYMTSPNNKVTYVSGGDFKDLKLAKFDNTGNPVSILVGKDADGFNRVMFAVVVASTAGSDVGYDTTNNKFTLGAGMGTSFGYLVDDSWTETIDGSNYNCFQIWNGSSVETVKVEAAAAFYDARSIISYDVVGEGIVKNVAVYTGMGATWGEDAITAFSSSSVELNGTTYALADDAVIFNVNDAQKTGVDGDALLTASEVASTGVYVKNARYVLNSNDEIVALVVDINNQLSHVDVDGITCANLDLYMDVVSDLTVVGNLTLDRSITIADKAFLTVDGTLTLSGHTITGNYAATTVVP